ncbi:amino acid permease [Piscirickettsia litoralis]|uniref:Amino acid permease n=1 Tax=Piscirickettsia litoralis TaxID=1891921 RepID=A0ABX3A323_9GAMM|nr:amino acid permease [Piscirickettsia litoralis]ODN41845.1 hypothetical protein BGC07_01225 [Piscirickettsia litoralis]
MTAPTNQKIGIIAATAIVAGNMMGSGIALLPSSLASIGSITLISWFLAAIGALALAYVYSTLGNRDPQPGGPVAYAGEVAPVFGYQTGLLYFHAGWVGNLAMALAGIDYLSVFFPVLTQPVAGGIATVIAIWLLTLLNLLGAAWIGRLVTISIIGILIPVILTGTIGWLTFKPDVFLLNWHVGASSSSFSVFSGVVLCIWAFIGIESASVNAGLVKNPSKTIPMATMLGTAIAALVYISSCTVISGMFPAQQVANSGAPFSLALEHIVKVLAPTKVDAGTINTISLAIKYIVAAATAFACLISLGSWIMMIAQAAARSAQDGTLPKIFAQTNEKGVPVKGIYIQAALSTGLMIVVSLIAASTNKNSQGMFGIIASVTVLFTVIPYFYSSLQLIRIERMDHVPFKRAILPVTMALIAIAWSFSALAGSGFGILISAILIIFGVFIFYAAKDRTELEKSMHALRLHRVEQLSKDYHTKNQEQ